MLVTFEEISDEGTIRGAKKAFELIICPEVGHI
jgi:hypothetical protein